MVKTNARYSYLNLAIIQFTLFYFSWLQPLKVEEGFLEDSFVTLKSKINDVDFRFCGLILDGMHIRKHVDYDRHADQLYGFTFFTAKCNEVIVPQLANEVMVFMAVGLKKKWTLPLAYFFISSLSGVSLAAIISETILRLTNVGVRCLSITLDGSAINVSALANLGFKWNDISCNWIKDPSRPSSKVYIFPDPCHMLKLIRNMLADWKVLYTHNGAVRWSHIAMLHAYQLRHGLSAANKLSEKHIYFERQKMKVSLIVIHL